ncbi:hypothetical protein ACBI99_41095 [Nonomuraea sp. ATR24]|uniref:hypothetical protein n=1 Tax=Nonomuraea TaxID=83681 RepID=UPI001C5D47F8|nr:hypothetical protein [Nonomuraea ceibae]
MTWILPAAVLLVAGLAVIAVAGRRAAVAARRLNREIAQVHQQFRHKENIGG